MFTGRPMPGPGEPLFLQEDTDAAVALAEEERDTCPSCGMPKAWCRNNEGGRSRFDVDESFCWATHRIAQRQDNMSKEKVDPATVRATQMAARFRAGQEPDITAGLNLSAEYDAS